MTLFLASAIPAVAVAALGWIVAAWARSSAGKATKGRAEGPTGRDAPAH